MGQKWVAQNCRQAPSIQQYAQVPSAAAQGVQLAALWLGGLVAGWSAVSRDDISQVLNRFKFVLGRIIVALYCSFQIFSCLDDSVDWRSSGSFDGMVIVLPRVSCTHCYCLVGGLNDAIVFQGGCKIPSLIAW